MGFQQGLSGLNSSAKLLDVIGNNVANANTVGFKQSQAQFADLYAASLQNTGNSQVGTGTKVASVVQQFTQGNITNTSNPMDVAISGQGYFIFQNTAGDPVLSRNGQLQLDNEGFFVNNLGHKLLAYRVSTTGVKDPTPSPMQITALDASSPAKATSSVVAGLNLDTRATFPANMTQPAITGTPLTYPIDTTPTGAQAGATVQVNVDGIQGLDPVSGLPDIPIPPGVYNTAAQLAAAIEGAVNAALLNATPAGTPLKSVSVSESVSTPGALVVKANSTGPASSLDFVDTMAVLGTPAGLVNGAGAFDPLDATTYNNSTSLTIYDQSGTPAIATLYFQKIANNSWNVFLSVGPVNGTSQLVPLAAPPVPLTTLDFNTAGGLMNASGGTNGVVTSAPFMTPASGQMTVNFDFNGVSQYGGNFGVSSLTQDGYLPGTLTSTNIGSKGEILGRYSNGQTRTLGIIALGTVSNSQGLQAVGGNEWLSTVASGPISYGEPGGPGKGLLTSSAVEDSNVDLTAELVNMITAQRVYQANAQTIKTQDQLLQTLVNMR